MSGHTPEPWFLAPDEFGVIGRVIASQQQTSGGKPDVVAFDVCEDNTRRIVACVNACAGMDDPAAEVASLRTENAAFRRNEDEAVAVAKDAGYTTPHGESDSINEAVKWMVEQLDRLRQLETDALAADQITKDGKFARVGSSLYHQKEQMPGAVRIHASGRPLWVEFDQVDDWDIHYIPINKYSVSECYSTPEAAEAARKETK